MYASVKMDNRRFGEYAFGEYRIVVNEYPLWPSPEGVRVSFENKGKFSHVRDCQVTLPLDAAAAVHAMLGELLGYLRERDDSTSLRAGDWRNQKEIVVAHGRKKLRIKSNRADRLTCDMSER